MGKLNRKMRRAGEPKRADELRARLFAADQEVGMLRRELAKLRSAMQAGPPKVIAVPEGTCPGCGFPATSGDWCAECEKWNATPPLLDTALAEAVALRLEISTATAPPTIESVFGLGAA